MPRKKKPSRKAIVKALVQLYEKLGLDVPPALRLRRDSRLVLTLVRPEEGER